MLGGWAIAVVARPLTALAGRGVDLVLRDGWVLRHDDLTRLGFE